MGINGMAAAYGPMVAERLSGLDAAFLCLESAQAPMHLGGLGVFQAGGPVTPQRVAGVLAERAARVPRLRRRVAADWLAPSAGNWVEDRAVDPTRHIHVHRLPAGSDEDLAEAAGRLMAEPLDLDRPLWQAHLLTGLAGGRFGLLVKLHHALADGLRAVQVGMGLLDGFADAVPAVTTRNGSGGGAWPLPVLRDVVRGAAGLAYRPDKIVNRLAAATAQLPRVAQAARDVAGVAGIAAAMLASTRLAGFASPLAARLPGRRRLALLRLPASDVRRVRRRFGGTDNDVLLSVLAGALRDWLIARATCPDDVVLRALVPVSRRDRDPAASQGPGSGNLLSGYLCPLPVRERDPVARHGQIRLAMDRNKSGGPSRGPGALPVLADVLPGPVHRLAAPLVRHRASLLFDIVVTNVPIPGLPLTLDGAGLAEVYPVVPLPEGHALGVALSCYRGMVHVGLHADQRALPDLPRLAAAIPDALHGLVAAADSH